MEKVALITGASSGIGKELAKIHAQKGRDLVVVARRKDKLEELKIELESEYSIQVHVIDKDLIQPDAPPAIYDEVKQAGIEVEYLINNAGFGGIGKFHERDWADDSAMIHLNVMALTHLTRLFLPDFVKRNSGRVLNVSSTAGMMPGPLQAVYFATKAYVTSFSNAVSEELSGTKVTVTALLPGATETEFGRISGMDKTDMFKNTADARRVAEDGYHGMEKGKLNVISGLPFAMKASMGLMPFLPKKLLLKMVHKMQKTD
ncbi:SDR family NAD(P)-dependent oxidoreductase [Marinilabilia rubra]|uniref:Short-chain dehydrogenase n=1 Tax=Marinilabilia rubra TaxID=2162893 RepID=A0A2U2B575_9BACT|nr:SDR family oxidoreductase [Marinilabilia rubra]PWD98205.1 short-chain dehydrogenase [Marinilabilia rubra]